MSGVVNALSRQAQAGTYCWVKTAKTATELLEGYDICAGIDADPQTWKAYNAVAMGPCTSDVEGPPVYMEQDLHDLIFVSSKDDYLTNETNIIEVDPYPNHLPYRDFSGAVEKYGGKYAFIQAGGFYGDYPEESGGYVGYANYLVTDGTLSTNVNDFYLAAGKDDNHTLRGDSEYGAPLGPYSVCISPLKNGACGDAISMTEGHFKFSMFGYTTGTAYQFPQINNAAAGYFGMRMEIVLKNMDGTTPSGVKESLSFNNDPKLTLDNIGHTNVKSFRFSMGKLGMIDYTFPTTYNIGTTPDGDSMTVPTPTSTKTVEIHVSAVKGNNNAVYVDYLFEGSDFAVVDKYFVYDPTITAVTGETASAAASTAATVVVALLGAAATAALL
jgi:hypothetical protein